MDDDDRLIKALAFANYKSTMVSQRENLKLRFANAMLHAHNGGIFTVSTALLAMVDVLTRHEQISGVLIDDKGIPIHIADLADFMQDILAIYGEATNDYLMAWDVLKKARSVEAIIEKVER